MKRLLFAASLLLLAQGCATNDCESLAYESAPQAAEPLKYPGDVREPTPTGDYRIPSGERALAEGCLAEPPQTLPPEALEYDPDEEEAESDDSDA